MPANLPPHYHDAEKRLREATTPEEKLAILQELMAIIPKHKGTDRLQGDLKRRMAKMRSLIEQARRSSGRRVDPNHVEREGIGQVALVGAPNSGKSALLRALTRAEPVVAPYPFATRRPLPGMMTFEDVHFQLIDLPAVDPAGDPWVFGVIRNADLAFLVVDLTALDPLEQAESVLKQLEERRILLQRDPEPDEPGTPRHMKALLLATKVDVPGADEMLELFSKEWHDRLPVFRVSTETGVGLDQIRKWTFDAFEVYRVYTKSPGKEPDYSQPYVLERGSTVLDLAGLIHKDFLQSFKYARVWGSARYDGQKVTRDYAIQDKDVVEICA